MTAKMTIMTERIEVAVVGGGPAGVTAAIALAQAGVPTALIAPKAADDSRTTALLAGSVTALDTLGVWARCRGNAAPLKAMRIVDATARLVRAPEICFTADEIGLDAFGYNIQNRHLAAALDVRAGELPKLCWIDDEAKSLQVGTGNVTITLKRSGAVTARLAVGADGRNSICRAVAGIETDRRAYPQTALAFNLRHTRLHHDTSTEFHTESGPFTLVPLLGQCSSLVWVVEPDEAGRLTALHRVALADEIERRSHSILGRIEVEPGHGAFPLSIETARRSAASRIALIGEAAHRIPPIGAQGLNLGLRDAATISELVVEAWRQREDVGADGITSRYDEERRGDVATRSLAVDLLNRSLLSDFVPVQGARGLGLYLIDSIAPLRRAVMREGLAPRNQPRLMRGEAL